MAYLTEYLQQMDREVLSKYDDMSVGEATGTTLAQTNNLVDDRRHELNMIFNFDAIKLGRSDFGLSQLGPWSLPELKAIYDAHAVQRIAKLTRGALRRDQTLKGPPSSGSFSLG